MKKIIIILLACFCLFGCSDNKPSDNNKENNKISIVTTIFPPYDWVKQITNGNNDIEITMLLDDGIDLHSFQPTVDDIIKVTTCDMFIYVGGESDEWVNDALAEATNKDMKVINLLDVLGELAKQEEIIEGMQAEDEEEIEEEIEYDEHVWLSLKNAQIFCKEIAKQLEDIDSQNKNIYENNLNNYLIELNDLDSDYQNVVKEANTKVLLFGDRFPFRYLVDDYGLSYYAAFVGCSAESEASFETIKFLADKVDELNLKTIMKIEGSNGKIAETIKNESKSKDQTILTMNSLQSVVKKDVENGTTYLSIMKENLDVLKQAIK